MKATHAGLTVKDAARRYRVSPDKIRRWIKAGELHAIDTATEGKPRYIIPPESLVDFERGRQAAVPEPPIEPRRRRRKMANFTDFYPN